MNTTPSQPNILVVDDTPANLHLLDDLLRRQGYQVRLFPRGAMALKAASAQPPDLILLDIMMPDMDGFEVCRQLKANPLLQDIPVIFISALADTEHKVNAFAQGGMDYVTKPFQEDEVLARVRTHLALYAMKRELTRQKQVLAEQVSERTADLLRAQRVAHVGSWKLDLQTQALSWSPETHRLFGVPEGIELTLDDFLAKVHPDDRDTVAQRWAQALQGMPYDVEHRITPPAEATWVRERAEFAFSPDGQAHTVWGTAQDISELKAHQAQVDFITHHDVLTGLPNRAQFLELLRVCMANSHTMQTRLAVAYLDLDGFAAINAQFGKDMGNQLMVEMARRLAQALRDRQYLARIGGDEFAVVLTKLSADDGYLVPVQRMLEAVSQPLELTGQAIQVTASIGVAHYPQGESVEAEQLLRQADQAMYMAKLAGKNRHHVFDPLKDGSTRERFLRLEEVRRGLLQGEMELFYQPKVWLTSGEVAGFEALIRWHHPQRGLLLPGQFIPWLEQHPLAIQVGNWVIETALAQLAQWNASGLHTGISVNIESLQLQDPSFVSRLKAQLAEQPTVQAEQLELEILETGALNNMTQVATLIAQLQQMGVSCALDDFGTGFSSLTFLKQLGAQTIKIDQSFVHGMLDDGEHASIVHSVLNLARGFDRLALAEGVETDEHGLMLVELGCDLAQGYAIARPMPAALIPNWLAQWHAPLSWQNTPALEGADVPLLLAEVEHRAWMKQLRAFLGGKTEAPPPLDNHACRFGQWLSRPSNRRRLTLAGEFDAIAQAHDAVHALGEQLVAWKAGNTESTSTPSPLPAEAPAETPQTEALWHRLKAQSKTLMSKLRSLRLQGNEAHSQLTGTLH